MFEPCKQSCTRSPQGHVRGRCLIFMRSSEHSVFPYGHHKPTRLAGVFSVRLRQSSGSTLAVSGSLTTPLFPRDRIGGASTTARSFDVTKMNKGVLAFPPHSHRGKEEETPVLASHGSVFGLPSHPTLWSVLRTGPKKDLIPPRCGESYCMYHGGWRSASHLTPSCARASLSTKHV